MGNQKDNFLQAQRNLDFLAQLETLQENNWDWKTTVCFYVAVHLINGHLAKFDLHYRSHVDVRDAINFANAASPSKVPEDVYFCFKKLSQLSRRSRYLINDSGNEADSIGVHLTYDKHFAKAVRHLDCILKFVNTTYGYRFNQIGISCMELKQNDRLEHFIKT